MDPSGFLSAGVNSQQMVAAEWGKDRRGIVSLDSPHSRDMHLWRHPNNIFLMEYRPSLSEAILIHILHQLQKHCFIAEDSSS